MKIREFIKECHRRDVFRNLSIYLVSSWVFIQVFSEIWEPFGLPKISMTYLLLVLIAGFPFYAYLIWRYRLRSPGNEVGINNNAEVVDDEDRSNAEYRSSGVRKHLPGIRFYSPFQRMYFTFLFAILLISVISVLWIVQANFIDQVDAQAFRFKVDEGKNKVAVLSFENNTMDPDMDVVGKMAVDWIIHGITRNEMGQVISPNILEQYKTVMKASMVSNGKHNILTEYLKPGKVISGNYYLNRGKLLMQCSIQDGDMTETLETIEPVTCDPDSPLTCIEQLKQRLLSALLEEGENYTVYEETPPNYEAYKLMLGANEFSNTAPEFLNIMNKAIDLDSTYFEPKLHRITYYYNTEDFATADSLVQQLLREDLKSPRQINLARLWNALIRGDNKKAYTYLKREYDIQPDDLNNNSSTMVVALQFVNRPEVVNSIYNTQLAMDKIDSLSCQTCEYRLFSKGMADIALGNPEKPISMFGEYGSVKGFNWVKDVLLYAYIRTGQQKEVDAVLNTIKLTDEISTWRKKCLLVGKQYLIQGEKPLAFSYLGKILRSLDSETSDMSAKDEELKAFASFYRGEYDTASQVFKGLLNQKPADFELTAFYAMSLLKNGKERQAEEQLEILENFRAGYQYGEIDYLKARYYALKGDSDLVIQHLIRAVAAGKRYNPGTFSDDVLFQPYKDLQGFRNVLTFWH